MTRFFTPARIVVLVGMGAALHVGKLPPALPVLRDALGITLVQSGFLLSLVQLAGMCLGLAVGLLADGFGLRRSMLVGLCILAAASVGGSFASSAHWLLALRALEGCGFLLVVLPGPSLIRGLVPPAQLPRTMGLWGTYMPVGTALALAAGPWVMGVSGWRAWWVSLGVGSLAMAVLLWRAVPDDRALAAPSKSQPAEVESWQQRLSQTLGAPGPWLAAACFGLYSGQWLAVVGFLPTVYAQAGISASTAGLLTALVALANMTGNLASGRLLQRGIPPRSLLFAGYATMALTTLVAYAHINGWVAPPAVQVLCVVAFSAVGGLIPGTLFSVAVQVAPSPRTVSTTVGWMQQFSALGQLCGPPIAAAVSAHVGGWHSTWWITLGSSCAGAGCAFVLGRVLARTRLSLQPVS